MKSNLLNIWVLNISSTAFGNFFHVFRHLWEIAADLMSSLLEKDFPISAALFLLGDDLDLSI